MLTPEHWVMLVLLVWTVPSVRLMSREDDAQELSLRSRVLMGANCGAVLFVAFVGTAMLRRPVLMRAIARGLYNAGAFALLIALLVDRRYHFFSFTSSASATFSSSASRASSSFSFGTIGKSAASPPKINSEPSISFFDVSWVLITLIYVAVGLCVNLLPCFFATKTRQSNGDLRPSKRHEIRAPEWVIQEADDRWSALSTSNNTWDTPRAIEYTSGSDAGGTGYRSSSEEEEEEEDIQMLANYAGPPSDITSVSGGGGSPWD